MNPHSAPVPRRSVLLILATGTLLTSAACTSETHKPKHPGAGQDLAAVDNLEPGTAVSSTTPGKQPVVLVRPASSDKVIAFSGVCTYDGGIVAVKGTTLTCPRCGSTFDAVTGKAATGRASIGLLQLRTVVKDGRVVTA